MSPKNYWLVFKRNKNKILFYGMGGLLLFALTISVLKSLSNQRFGRSFGIPSAMDSLH